MHGDRPWDFEQEFQVDGDGEATPVGGDSLLNHTEFITANAVQREEVRDMVGHARERHHGQHLSGCHECAVWEARHLGATSALLDVSTLTNENTGYPPVRQAFTGHLGEP